MKNKQISNLILILLIFVSTLTVISTNYYFSKQIIYDITNKLRENEYSKIGGKENYLILQEIQKREITGYLKKLQEEQPELIKEIKVLISEKNNLKNEYKILDNKIIKELKENTKIKGFSGAVISIIQFSDIKNCSYCIEQDKKNIPNRLLDKYSDNLNYFFKTMKNHDLLQAQKLGIKLIPSSLIINNLTGKFIIISEVQEIKVFENVINELLEK